MSKMLDRVRPRIRAMEKRVRRKTDGGPTLQRQIRRLRARVVELEAEVIENRQLARRIAELTDVVEQQLLTESARQELAAERRRHMRTDSA